MYTYLKVTFAEHCVRRHLLHYIYIFFFSLSLFHPHFIIITCRFSSLIRLLYKLLARRTVDSPHALVLLLRKCVLLYIFSALIFIHLSRHVHGGVSPAVILAFAIKSPGCRDRGMYGPPLIKLRFVFLPKIDARCI